MGLTEFYYLAATLTAGILATAGYGVLSLTPSDFRVVRCCFWGAALLFASISVVWGITTSESAWVRIPAVALVGAIAALSLSEELRWVIGRETKTLVQQSAVEAPDVALRFVYPKSPALVLVNESGAIARNIKSAVALWNMDDPRTYVNPNASPDAHDPLPIPVATFDFLRPRTAGGPQNLFDSPLVAPHIKNGQRLFGSASIICPECARGHTYIFSIIWGEGGWYVEALNSREGELLIPANFNKETVAAFFREIVAQTPESARIPIQDK